MDSGIRQNDEVSHRIRRTSVNDGVSYQNDGYFAKERSTTLMNN